MNYFFVLFSVLFFSLPLQAKQENKVPTSEMSSNGVPGQVEKLSNGYKIYFESGYSVDWMGLQWVLKDAQNKKISEIKIGEIASSPSSSLLGSEVIEQDLGGVKKKKAPLAYKNPKVKNIQMPARGDPLLSSGMQPSQVTEEKTPEGGVNKTTLYPDGSKNISFLSSDLKMENSYDKVGKLVWRNLEGSEKGLKYKKTQWEEGSLIREYVTSEGVLSFIFDSQRNTMTFSFLNSERENIRDVVCDVTGCD